MTLLAGQTSEHGARVVHSTRSSSVTFDLDSPREVHSAHTGYSHMVARVIVMCSWRAGGYNLLPGYPTATVRCDEGAFLSVSQLASIPDWLSDLIAAGTPTDLEHPAS